MVSRKALACALLAWGLSGTQTHADSLSNGDGWLNWNAFSTSTGESWAPPSTTTTTTTNSSASAAQTLTPTYNAFVNLGAAPYPGADTITSGNAQPWYNSSQISSFFGGQPTSQQITNFDNTIMQRVEQTFQQSGVAVTLTDDPTQTASHTLSLVSNTSAAMLSNAIGMTYVGGNGFSFIDQEAKAATSLDQLEWIVAHNISHELMLAFGVGENYDQTGNYIDARNAQFSMLTGPSSTFSSAAAQALNQALASQNNSSTSSGQFAQVVEPKPVPEPATLAIWGLTASLAFLYRRRFLGSRS